MATAEQIVESGKQVFKMRPYAPMIVDIDPRQGRLLSAWHALVAAEQQYDAEHGFYSEPKWDRRRRKRVARKAFSAAMRLAAA